MDEWNRPSRLQGKQCGQLSVVRVRRVEQGNGLGEQRIQEGYVVLPVVLEPARRQRLESQWQSDCQLDHLRSDLLHSVLLQSSYQSPSLRLVSRIIEPNWSVHTSSMLFFEATRLLAGNSIVNKNGCNTYSSYGAILKILLACTQILMFWSYKEKDTRSSRG